MALSTLTTLTPIPERSEAIPSLWNTRYSIIDANFASLPRYPVVSGEVGVTDISYPYGDVRRYGAVGDGVTDDGPAIQRAITAAVGGNEVVIPPGTYSVSANIELPEGVVVRGVGRPASRRTTSPVIIKPTSAVTKVFWAAGSTASGTAYSHDVAAEGVGIRGVAFDLSSAAATCRAISFEGVWYSFLKDLAVYGFTADTQYGYYITIASGTSGGSFWNTIDNCQAIGEEGDEHGIGFCFQGDAADGNPTVTQHAVSNIQGTFLYRGMVIDNCGAGLTFHNAAMEVCADNGVTITNHRATDVPLFVGGEFSTNGGWGITGLATCINTAGATNTSGNFDSANGVQRWRGRVAGYAEVDGVGFTAEWLATEYTATSVASGATLSPSKGFIRLTSTSGAVTLDGTTQISDGERPGQLLVLQGGSNTDYVTLVNGGNLRLLNNTLDLLLDEIVVLAYNDSLSNWCQIAQSRLFRPLETLADSATPSVHRGEHFVTGGTTTITNFTNGAKGQTISILSAHSVTITHSGSIALSGSVDFVMAAGDTLTLKRFDASTWVEVARMVA